MNVLQKIIRQKEKEIAIMHNDMGIIHVCGSAQKNEVSLIDSLRSKKPALLAEIKPKSPSKGEIIHRQKANDYVHIYNKYAQGVSVLCDHEFFGGGYNLLQEIRIETNLPILAKEFIIDPVQIQMARASGANAVLLIANLLDTRQLNNLCDTALRLQMDILLEIHTAEEMEKIPNLPASNLMLGVNNRNLDTLDIDLSTTKTLGSLLREKYPEHILISESGIETREDIETLQETADAFLIGTTILQSDDPEQTINQLFPVL